LSSYVSGQKPGGGITGHAKRVGRRPDPKFDHILKILRICNLNSKINLKISVELNIFSHFVKFWLNSIFIFLFFMDLPGA
jgi:hypothetical protein